VATLGVFLAAAVVFSLVWGRTLWYCDEQSQAFRRFVLFFMGFTRRRSSEVRALSLSAIYYGLGLVAALLFATTLGLRVSYLPFFSGTHLVLAILGAVGEISLTNLLVDLGCRVTGQGGPERFAEMKEIPWMKGIQQLPAAVVPGAAALGGAIEELFFRGVLLRILTERLLVAPLAAVAIAGILFGVQQLVQVRTAFQALVIGCGCVSLSLVGGLLVVLTGSVVPAVLCHASFVVFFMTQGAGSLGSSRGKAEAGAR
jgi:membrane protease YdiL (CAAX protease family)